MMILEIHGKVVGEVAGPLVVGIRRSLAGVNGQDSGLPFTLKVPFADVPTRRQFFAEKSSASWINDSALADRFRRVQ